MFACVKFGTGNPNFALGLQDQNGSFFAFIGKQVAQVFKVQIRDSPCGIKARQSILSRLLSYTSNFEVTSHLPCLGNPNSFLALPCNPSVSLHSPCTSMPTLDRPTCFPWALPYLALSARPSHRWNYLLMPSHAWNFWAFSHLSFHLLLPHCSDLAYLSLDLPTIAYAWFAVLCLHGKQDKEWYVSQSKARKR